MKIYSKSLCLFLFASLSGCAAMSGLKADDNSAALRVDNESGRKVVAVQMTRPDANYWGPNLLDGYVLQKNDAIVGGTTDRPKDSLFVKKIPPGVYKVRAIDDKAEWRELGEVRLAAGDVQTVTIEEGQWRHDPIRTADDFKVVWKE